MNLNRRLFLRGLGGASVAAPFLGSVVERQAKAQGAPVLGSPKRLIVMFTHYGCLTDRWFPENSHGALSAADFEGTSIEALAPHADKLLLPRGIRAMNEWTTDLSLGQGNDQHTQVVGSYFTCVPVSPHSDEPFDFDQAKKFEAMPTAPSLDHVCAKQVSPDGVPLLLRVGGRSDSPQSAISYSAGLSPFAGAASLAEALASLTGLFSGGAPTSPDEHLVVRGKSLLDVVRDDLETLERYDMSSADEEKLDAWKQLLSETTSGVEATRQCNAEMAANLGLTEETISASSMGIGSDISVKIDGELDAADLYSKLAVLTTLCDANRVIFLKYPPAYTYGGLGLVTDSDILAHRVGASQLAGTCQTSVNNMILTIDRYYAEKFAHLVGQLDSISEGEGTLLDNTATVWFQENSDGCASNLNNMPIVQAGGCGGYFKTGQAINVDDGTSDLHRGNSEAMCEGGGTFDSTEYKLAGTPVEFANAPINKYYCNLMNAIGVKADASGFPTEGGTQEVTHYGMYDDTTDFISGGETPAIIKDPGEFTQLKANS